MSLKYGRLLTHFTLISLKVTYWYYLIKTVGDLQAIISMCDGYDYSWLWQTRTLIKQAFYLGFNNTFDFPCSLAVFSAVSGWVSDAASDEFAAASTDSDAFVVVSAPFSTESDAFVSVFATFISPSAESDAFVATSEFSFSSPFLLPSSVLLSSPSAVFVASVASLVSLIASSSASLVASPASFVAETWFPSSYVDSLGLDWVSAPAVWFSAPSVVWLPADSSACLTGTSFFISDELTVFEADGRVSEEETVLSPSADWVVSGRVVCWLFWDS